MSIVLVTVTVLLALAGIALTLAGVAAFTSRLKGNPYFGVRVPETRSNEEAWIIANKAAGPLFILSGIVLVIAAATPWIFSSYAAVIAPILCSIAAVIIAGYAGLIGAKAAAIWKANQEANSSCCSDQQATDAADPAKDCGESAGCGSCSLAGMCDKD